jgi:hypothetical protein
MTLRLLCLGPSSPLSGYSHQDLEHNLYQEIEENAEIVSNSFLNPTGYTFCEIKEGEET